MFLFICLKGVGERERLCLLVHSLQCPRLQEWTKQKPEVRNSGPSGWAIIHCHQDAASAGFLVGDSGKINVPCLEIGINVLDWFKCKNTTITVTLEKYANREISKRELRTDLSAQIGLTILNSQRVKTNFHSCPSQPKLSYCLLPPDIIHHVQINTQPLNTRLGIVKVILAITALVYPREHQAIYLDLETNILLEQNIDQY